MTQHCRKRTGSWHSNTIQTRTRMPVRSLRRSPTPMKFCPTRIRDDCTTMAESRPSRKEEWEVEVSPAIQWTYLICFSVAGTHSVEVVKEAQEEPKILCTSCPSPWRTCTTGQ